MPNQTNHSKCISCGVGDMGLNNCAACSWPYSNKGWSQFVLGLRRITIDTNCINAKRAIIALNLLEKWKTEEKIEIQKSTPFSIEAQGTLAREAKAKNIPNHPPLFILDSSALGSGAVLAGPDIRNKIQRILFPGVSHLSVNQERDVQYLGEHVRTGGHLFVTLDKSDFRAGNKERQLRALGIWAVSPEKAVNFIHSVYDWD
jgi:hypothetical protein